MNMIGHHYPSEETISDTVKFEQRVLNHARNLADLKECLPMSLVEVSFDTSLQTEFLVEVGDRLEFLLPSVNNLVWNGVGEVKSNELRRRPTIEVREIAATMPASLVELFEIRIQEERHALDGKAARKLEGRLAGKSPI